MMTWVAVSSGFSSWLHMDGDGAYVWPCYLITAVVLTANVWVARRRHRKLRLEAATLQQQAAVRAPTHRVDGGSK